MLTICYRNVTLQGVEKGYGWGLLPQQKRLQGLMTGLHIYSLRGRLAILNFPGEYPETKVDSDITSSSSSLSPLLSSSASSSSSMPQNAERSGTEQDKIVFEIEYLDDKLLEDLLDFEKENTRKSE